ALIEEELDDRAIAVGADDGDIRLTVAVDVAEGGTGRTVAPADDDDVLLRDAKTRIGACRLDEAPADRLADIDARLKIVARPLDGAVARQDVIDLQIVQLLQAGEDIGGAEVDAAGVAEHAPGHDEIAEGNEGLAGFLEVPGHGAGGVPGDADRLHL